MNLNLLDPKLIALVAAVIVIIAVLAWLYVRKRRSTTEDLRQKFGPEYDRAVLKHGSEGKVQSKLEDREKRVEKLNIRDLDPTEHERFSKRWESVQSRFVDSPKGAVTEADDLISSLMKARGYFERPCPLVYQVDRPPRARWGIRIETERVPLADIENAWQRDEQRRRLVVIP